MTTSHDATPEFDRYRRFWDSDAAETFWPETESKLPVMKDIIASHFGRSCTDLTLLGEGAYARAYETSLSTGQKLVVRVVLPVRDGLKTEAEVATMDFVRARTTIPVPRVHLFCSTRDNPLGAEWIVMDFLPGERLMDCWDDLTLDQQRRTASDLARIFHELYSVTSELCGSLLADNSLLDDQRAKRFGDRPPLPPTVESDTASGHFTVGPANDFPFLEPFVPAPFERCGPFRSERLYLEAVAFANILDTDPDIVKFRRGPYEKVLEVYDLVHAAYSSSMDSVPGVDAHEDALFHLCHGDLSMSNILLDRSTGKITGIIDWEVSGFRPAWLAAGSGEWLDEEDDADEDEDEGSESGHEGEEEDEGPASRLDSRLFYQDPPRNITKQSPEERQVRDYFLTQLETRRPALAHHQKHGGELRAMYQALRDWLPGNVGGWLNTYEAKQWSTADRGPFPFDIDPWRTERIQLWKSLHDAGVRV